MELFDMFFPRVYAPFPNNFIDLGCAHARLYRRAFLKEKGVCNTPGLKRMQDNVFNLWAIEKAEKVCYQCRRLYHYRFNAEAATQKYAPNHAENMYFLYQCMEDFIRRNHDEPGWQQRLYCRFIRIFGEMFKLNYANPENRKVLKERLAEIERDLNRDKFREAIDRFDPSEQNMRIRFIHESLKNRRYLQLLIYYHFSIRLRRFRLILKMR